MVRRTLCREMQRLVISTTAMLEAHTYSCIQTPLGLSTKQAHHPACATWHWCGNPRPLNPEPPRPLQCPQQVPLAWCDLALPGSQPRAVS